MTNRPTVRELVHQLGGPGAVAKALGVSLPAVCNWYRSGIPRAQEIAVWRLAQDKGVDWAPLSVAGLTPPPAPTQQAA